MANKKPKNKKRIRKILANIKILLRQNQKATTEFIESIPPQYWNKQA